jgi:hypothetical protein
VSSFIFFFAAAVREETGDRRRLDVMSVPRPQPARRAGLRVVNRFLIWLEKLSRCEPRTRLDTMDHMMTSQEKVAPTDLLYVGYPA